MTRRILVKVSPSGEITVEAEGFTGKRCTDATKAIEDGLGTRISREHKPEFRRLDHTTRSVQSLGNGEGES